MLWPLSITREEAACTREIRRSEDSTVSIHFVANIQKKDILRIILRKGQKSPSKSRLLYNKLRLVIFQKGGIYFNTSVTVTNFTEKSLALSTEVTRLSRNLAVFD